MKTGFLSSMWGPAILIGISTMLGLLLALLGDGTWDWVSAIALGVPVTVAIWCSLKRRGSDYD